MDSDSDSDDEVSCIFCINKGISSTCKNVECCLEVDIQRFEIDGLVASFTETIKLSPGNLIRRNFNFSINNHFEYILTTIATRVFMFGDSNERQKLKTCIDSLQVKLSEWATKD